MLQKNQNIIQHFVQKYKSREYFKLNSQHSDENPVDILINLEQSLIMISLFT